MTNQTEEKKIRCDCNRIMRKVEINKGYTIWYCSNCDIEYQINDDDTRNVIS